MNTPLPFAAPDRIPRLPTLGWDALGRQLANKPLSVLDLPHRLFTTSGRAAIALALQEIGVSAGDRILLPTYHCPTMVAPAVQARAQVEYYPVQAKGTADIDYVEQELKKGAKAILVAHYFGLPQPMADIRSLCDRYGAALIEDCAHALFGEVEGRNVGEWGDYAIVSLTKFFPVSEGGCLASARHPIRRGRGRDRGKRSELKVLIDVLEIASSHGRLAGANSLLRGVFAMKNLIRGTPRRGIVPIPSDWSESELLAEFDPSRVDLNLSRVARWVTEHTDRSRIIAHRRSNYERLNRLLEGIPGTHAISPRLPPGAVPYVYPLWSENPDERFLALWAEGIPAFRWDRLWPGTPVIANDSGLDWSRHVIQLPCHQDLSERDIDLVHETLRRKFR